MKAKLAQPDRARPLQVNRDAFLRKENKDAADSVASASEAKPVGDVARAIDRVHVAKGDATMREFKHGTLHSGSKQGPKVKSRKQAIAIGLSEERAAGKSVPSPKRGGRMKKALHGRHGKITSMDETDDGKNVEIRITHGKRKRSKDMNGKSTGELMGYSRQHSHSVMSKADAKEGGYKVGDHVFSGITHATAANPTDDDYENDQDDDGDEEQSPVPAPKKGGKSKGGKPFGKKSAGKPKASPAILSAMKKAY